MTDYDVATPFDGEGPADLSGIACIPAEQGKPYRCLAVNDETQTAQFATVEDGDHRCRRGNSPDRRIPRPGNRRHSAADPSPAPGSPTTSKSSTARAWPMPRPISTSWARMAARARRASSDCPRSSWRAFASTSRDGRSIEAGNVLTGGMHDAVETTYRLSDLLPRVHEAGAYFGRGARRGQQGTQYRRHRRSGREPVRRPARSVDRRQGFHHARQCRRIVQARPRACAGDGSGSRRYQWRSAPMSASATSRSLPDGRLLILAGAASGDEIPYRIFAVDPTGANLAGAGAAANRSADARRSHDRAGRDRSGNPAAHPVRQSEHRAAGSAYSPLRPGKWCGRRDSNPDGCSASGF